eukprot:13228513-Alexandrium_andersonii.AAC.1
MSRLAVVVPRGSRLLAIGVREAAGEVVFTRAYCPRAGYEQEARQAFYGELAELVESFGNARP